MLGEPRLPKMVAPGETGISFLGHSSIPAADLQQEGLAPITPTFSPITGYTTAGRS
jgi:hypothetical protein